MATISGSRAVQGSDAAADIGASHPYTCNTCLVAFRNNDLQKGHMRSDWHRYNLKRRVASLPPITSETFTDKVLQARAASTAQADKAGFEKGCDICQKSYFTENAYRNHLGSAKHKAKVAAAPSSSNAKVDDEASSMVSSTFSLGEPADDKSEVDSDAEEEFNEMAEGLKNTGLQDRKSPVKRPSNPRLSAAANRKVDHPVSQTASEPPSKSATPSTAVPGAPKGAVADPSLKTCLFCNYESPTPPLNALHMERIHGMFIPEKPYLVNLEGLLGALQERVFVLNECLLCSKVKANTYAVQTHMRDKGHCQIPFTTTDEQLEIGEFYDFRNTYSDDETSDDESEDESMEDIKPNGGAKLGARRSSKATGDGDKKMEDDGWETDSSASSLDSDDLHAVPAEQHYHQYARLDKHPHHSRDDQRAHRQRDGFHAHNHKRAHAVFYDEYELHLPSGKSVGHRSLNKYYRQNLHSYPSPAEREEREGRLAIEAAEAAENEMDVDGDSRQVAVRDSAAHGRALVNRDLGGLGGAGATDQSMAHFKGIIMRGRKKEFSGQRQREVGHSKRYFKEVHRNPVSYLR
ncbi:C2H2 type zinc-finger-domain-containing protein [Lasiosphaeria miniovina]|uniref:C2H2 type zinc-finger-domain-containing protein n=1 Tax=Lasiosphaeria miniovina TaxID=1954250 RepID=A0AA40A570_9PEZI|nr:C2H2 type zinc-finger-domain-containing protein [Lasiosphaeria miniovina]KAK0709467.1 C2H2 type zinc-finger-domain-containing protein [Lasiosphaeria miniovina]